jgi:uncharacterized protein (DUF697 family)
MTEPAPDSTGLQAELADKMLDLFQSVVDERRAYYTQHADRVPRPEEAPAIIAKYATLNMGVSGGAGLVPGPWGMAAAIPELALILRNQLAMVYDIGMAYGQGDALRKELLAGVLASAVGAGGISLLTSRGGQVLVSQVSLQAFQRLVALLAGRVTQQLLASMVSKWLPLVGGAAMAAWSNYSTRQVGKKAVEIFSKEIAYVAPEGDALPPAAAQPAPLPAGVDYAVLKLRALIHLLKVDRQATPAERDYMQAMIQTAALDDRERAALLASLDADAKFSIEYDLLAGAPDEAVGLLIDMLALSRRDQHRHVAEKLYIKQAGRLMGFSDDDLEELLAGE